jgi:hypothetical protein
MNVANLSENKGLQVRIFTDGFTFFVMLVRFYKMYTKHFCQDFLCKIFFRSEWKNGWLEKWRQFVWNLADSFALSFVHDLFS